jgi:hypothetical protein
MELEIIKNWANDNTGIIALATLVLTFVSAVLAFVYRLIPRKKEKLWNRRNQLERNKKWQKEFTEYIEDTYAKYGDIDRAIVIRDFGRIEQYPKAKNCKGISPLFKVWLVSTYYNGIMVSFGMMEITYIKAVEDNTNWYYCDNKEPNGKKVFLLGKIPYDRIEEVNWRGDEWSDYDPQVFCRFDSKSNEPYDELVYCERIERKDLWAYYREVVKLQNMRNERVC